MKVPSTLAIAEPAELYALARFACNQIERHAADLVLVGMPGGQGTLLATQALWAATRAAPFPPVAAIHLSEQHVANYAQLPHRVSGYRLVGFALDILEAGPYLAWVHRQTAWQAELRAAVEAALGLGRAPTGVVVLGERDPEEVTAPLALGLLASVYPAAHARYVSGPGGYFGSATYWPIHFIDEWLNGSQLATASALAADDDIWGSISGDLISLALAGETTGPETLSWQAYGTEHPAIARLSGYFPRTDLLALPGWAADAFQQMILARHRTQTRPRRRPRSGQKPTRPHPYFLPPDFLIGRELWLRRRLTAAEAAHSAGIMAEEAAQSLERCLTPGLLETEDADVGGVRTYCLRNRVGILAYGSLRADPGTGLTPYVERRIALTTPFPVEYVRSSPTRAGAPVLVPVPAGYGAPAPAEVLVLAPEVDRETAGALLQRRKLDRASDDDMWFAADAEEMAVRELAGLAGLPVVLYAAGAPNLPEVIPDDIPVAEKAETLARLAIASLTPDTAAAGHDGIRYLADAIAQGIITPLTEPYRQAVLRLTGAADLAAARATVAAQNASTDPKAAARSGPAP
jgi:hypothetical protein